MTEKFFYRRLDRAANGGIDFSHSSTSPARFKGPQK
jgi:hypothetical protein